MSSICGNVLQVDEDKPVDQKPVHRTYIDAELLDELQDQHVGGGVLVVLKSRKGANTLSHISMGIQKLAYTICERQTQGQIE